jgi:putative toxin-antitoxin system antitoxin component (TIGR02293 family)
MSESKKHNEPSLLHEPAVAYGMQGNLLANIFSGYARYYDSLGDYELVQLTRKGLPKRILLSLAKKISLTIQELANIMHISERTLQRYEDDEIVKAEYAEKGIELARLYTRGEEVFDSAEKFKIWIRTPSVIFNGESPLSLLDTSAGFNMVFTELGRIEHGVFA